MALQLRRDQSLSFKKILLAAFALLVAVSPLAVNQGASALAGAPGSIVTPTLDQVVTKGLPLELRAENVDAKSGPVQWAVRYNTCSAGTNTVAGNVDGKHTASTWTDGVFTASVDTSTFVTGNYCFVFNPTLGTRLTRNFSVADDTTAPVITMNTPAGDIVTNANVLVSVTLTDNVANNTLSVYVNDAGGAYVAGCTSASNLDSYPEWKTSYTTDCILDISTLPDGSYTLIARSQDRAGNYATDVTRVVRIDRSAPVVTLSDIAPVEEGDAVSVSGTVDDLAVTQGQVFIDGSPAIDGIIDIINGAFSFTITGFSTGSYSITVRATDAANNQGVSDAKVAVVNPVPPAPTTTPTPAGSTDTDDGVLPETPETEVVPQLFTAPLLASQAILGDQTAAQPESEQGVAGAETEGDNQDVKGSTDVKQDAKTEFAWYWWLLIGAALIALWMIFAAWSRSRRSQD